MKYLIILFLILIISCSSDLRNQKYDFPVPESALETVLIIQHNSRMKDTLVVKATSIWKRKNRWQIYGVNQTWLSDIKPIKVKNRTYTKMEIQSIFHILDSIKKADDKIWEF